MRIHEVFPISVDSPYFSVYKPHWNIIFPYVHHILGSITWYNPYETVEQFTLWWLQFSRWLPSPLAGPSSNLASRPNLSATRRLWTTSKAMGFVVACDGSITKNGGLTIQSDGLTILERSWNNIYIQRERDRERERANIIQDTPNCWAHKLID